MKILCIAEEFPWPAVTGYRIRLAAVVRALGELGEVDLFAVVADGRAPTSCVAPEDVHLGRMQVVTEYRKKSRILRMVRWSTSRLPRTLLARRWSHAFANLRAWDRSGYDMIWFSHVDSYLALRELVEGRTVVDLDTLEDRRLKQRLTAIEADRAAGRNSRMRQSWAYAFARRVVDPADIRRWARIQRRTVAAASVVTVCSDLDRAILDAANVVVLPNSYDDAAVRSRPDSDRDTAVLTMVAVLAYEPNSDGIWWFADNVLPRVHAARADATFHVVGRQHHSIEPLRDRPGIVLRGFVDDISAELDTADVVIVPLRSGGGTRVKILEAFAHRVPVVATSAGCEGLAVVDREHLLIADDADAFADACLSLLSDRELRARITSAAASLLEQTYSPARFTSSVADIAARISRMSIGNAST